jgi:hypothetical protein
MLLLGLLYLLPKKARGDDSKIEENSNNGDQATQ